MEYSRLVVELKKNHTAGLKFYGFVDKDLIGSEIDFEQLIEKDNFRTAKIFQRIKEHNKPKVNYSLESLVNLRKSDESVIRK